MSIMDNSEIDAAIAAAESAGPGYTGLPCQVCGRIRVYLRRDGQYICEKCESFNDAPRADAEQGGQHLNG